MRPLLVGSVYAGGEHDPFWLGLQRHQLDLTVGPYVHAVYLGHQASPSAFSGSFIVEKAGRASRNEHLDGLRCLATYAAHNAQSYCGFLVLDSDAFPIFAGWREMLNAQLDTFQKPYAAAVRTENLDCFPHPCVAYSPHPSTVAFHCRSSVNLLGRTVSDIACVGNDFLPLLKSNPLNIHPVLATIYSSCFYHHGCGSRRFEMRSTQEGFYEHVLSASPSSDQLREALRSDPSAFLKSLSTPALLETLPHREG